MELRGSGFGEIWQKDEIVNYLKIVLIDWEKNLMGTIVISETTLLAFCERIRAGFCGNQWGISADQATTFLRDIMSRLVYAYNFGARGATEKQSTSLKSGDFALLSGVVYSYVSLQGAVIPGPKNDIVFSPLWFLHICLFHVQPLRYTSNMRFHVLEVFDSR